MALRYMQFNVKKVFDFLGKHRHVLTVRGYDYHTEFANVADLNVTIRRVKVCEIKQESDLNGFVTLSGFKTASEWWTQIKIFCKGRMWLYRCTIIDEELNAPEREQQHIDDAPGFTVDRNAYRDENDPTTIEEYNIYDDMRHPGDIRRGAELRDPGLVDLQPFRDVARVERIRKDEEATARKQERMRELYGEQNHAAAPTQDMHNPDKIKSVSSAERTLARLAKGETIEPAPMLTAAEIGRLPMTEYQEFMEQQVRMARGRVALQPTRKTREEHAREVYQIIDARIDDLKHDIHVETDIDTRLRMVYELKEASETLCGA